MDGFAFQYLEKKWKIWKYKKLREKTPGNLDKKSLDKNVPFLSSNFFANFPLFFQEKQEKMEKQEKIPKFGNLTEGKIFGWLRIPKFGKKMENMEIQNIARKKIWKFRQKILP